MNSIQLDDRICDIGYNVEIAHSTLKIVKLSINGTKAIKDTILERLLVDTFYLLGDTPSVISECGNKKKNGFHT